MSVLRLIIIVLAAISGVVRGEGLCFVDPSSTEPLISGQYSRSVDSNVTPSDVFMHLKRLQLQFDAIDLPALKEEVILPVDKVSPRTNLLQAYDLFVLLYLFHQQQQGFSSSPPHINFADDIQPYHVYQWIDATHALFNCMSPSVKDRTAQEIAAIKGNIAVTPQDVLYMLENQKSRLMQVLSSETLDAYISIRLMQIQYLLQSMAITNRQTFIIDWRFSEQSTTDTNLVHVALSGLEKLIKITDAKYVTFGSLPASLTSQDNNRLVFFLMALIHGEVLWINVRDMGHSVPPMMPITDVFLKDDEKIQRMLDINRLIGLLDSHEGVQ